MALTKKVWTLNSYTNSTWTDLVAGDASGDMIASLVICNTGASDITLSMRVANSGGSSLAQISSSALIAAGGSYEFFQKPLNLVSSQKFQINASAAGLQFMASGVQH